MIIDGQQRITTVILMILVLRNAVYNEEISARINQILRLQFRIIFMQFLRKRMRNIN